MTTPVVCVISGTGAPTTGEMIMSLLRAAQGDEVDLRLEADALCKWLNVTRGDLRVVGLVQIRNVFKESVIVIQIDPEKEPYCRFFNIYGLITKDVDGRRAVARKGAHQGGQPTACI